MGCNDSFCPDQTRGETAWSVGAMYWVINRSPLTLKRILFNTLGDKARFQEVNRHMDSEDRRKGIIIKVFGRFSRWKEGWKERIEG